ncbi:MarR family winged helix-turn-helix transcriptional regulator [Lacrimispora indolis]|uniref:MarR family winged helix-turn-helix transcriptional regulator n=1 Tax=Lacrimispora indolis TaxID=69825 RepID=UPI00041BC759|nr:MULTISPECIES: MarR family winged helix-turn-helix transcriptional regulator [Lachnospiraceae]MBE7718530.1 winged helix-turn-helix transcriptional regulator [Lacrimispora celerecrescens]
MKQHDVRELLVREEKARKQMISPLLSNIGLTPGQGHARILYNLLQKDHITQKELADRCRFDAATMSRNIDKLQDMGFLLRENNPDCRRSFLISLTEKGLAEAEETRKVFQQFEELICSGIPEDEIDIFCKVLIKMCDNLEAYKTPVSNENKGECGTMA